MSDERIHSHIWENGRCKICGVESQHAESSLPPAPGWKHEPVTSKQAKQIVNLLEDIKSRLYWLIVVGVMIWFSILIHK